MSLGPPMIKLGTPAGWETLPELAALVPVLRSGRVGAADRGRLVKRAGANALKLAAAAAELRPGEVPVHLIAAGADEFMSCNRNGDSFDAWTLSQAHPTFVKHARWYRHHDHHLTSPHYGRVVASAYEPALGRVDLLVALYGTKTAADAARGRVADVELQKLGSSGDLYVSMGCRVSHDVCSACGNRAATRAAYCGPSTCPGGGCRGNLARVVKLASGDLHRVRVFNPQPKFFDISLVETPAAPYAVAAAAGWHPAAAATGRF